MRPTSGSVVASCRRRIALKDVTSKRPSRSEGNDRGSSKVAEGTQVVRGHPHIDRGAPDGNQIILQCNDDDRTNLERDKCKKDAVGNSYTFAGTISDVRSDGKIDVRIDSGNYANVYLSGGGGAKFKKGDNVRFRGKLTFVGSGIMFQHDIKDATLM